ncbi:unnamed protein product [Nippostrongylus brasiliensis]|uniref:WD_REPEATS_REGION domain-containing protein n=1 Tax=Nippostrongylus brasiliensis TaxID=27835 RepID=A0A0N4YJG4_NIPBR|nr:unnamed protein product [Nippostrongylus brasiliensis]
MTEKRVTKDALGEEGIETSFTTPLGSSREHVKGCQFLELVGNGEDCNVLGCWAIGDGSRNSRKAAKLACLRVNFDDEEAEKTASKIDEALPLSTCSSFNTLGLDFSLNGESVDVTQPVLVDMAVAPVDSDVTCVLYVTAESRITDQGRVASVCNVVLQPMSALCSDDDDFEDGDLIYMGLRDSDVILSDLRMKSHHVAGCLRGSRSSGWIRQLRLAYPQCVLIENFRGDLKLYDSRRSDKELMSFNGHKNTHFRLPCTVDSQENFVFAVGSDGCTRGWSLASGDQLCAVPCPRPVDDRTDFPRVVYSSAWGGRVGSSALVLAVGDSLRIHHIDA